MTGTVREKRLDVLLEPFEFGHGIGKGVSVCSHISALDIDVLTCSLTSLDVLGLS